MGNNVLFSVHFIKTDSPADLYCKVTLAHDLFMAVSQEGTYAGFTFTRSQNSRKFLMMMYVMTWSIFLYIISTVSSNHR